MPQSFFFLPELSHFPWINAPSIDKTFGFFSPRVWKNLTLTVFSIFIIDFMGERILRGPNSIIFGDIISLKILLCDYITWSNWYLFGNIFVIRCISEDWNFSSWFFKLRSQKNSFIGCNVHNDLLDVENYWEKIEHFYFIFKNKVNGCLEYFLQFWFVYVKKS